MALVAKGGVAYMVYCGICQTYRATPPSCYATEVIASSSRSVEGAFLSLYVCLHFSSSNCAEKECAGQSGKGSGGTTDFFSTSFPLHPLFQSMERGWGEVEEGLVPLQAFCMLPQALEGFWPAPGSGWHKRIVVLSASVCLQMIGNQNTEL